MSGRRCGNERRPKPPDLKWGRSPRPGAKRSGTLVDPKPHSGKGKRLGLPRGKARRAGPPRSGACLKQGARASARGRRQATRAGGAAAGGNTAAM